jgi:hypothetical protein
MTVVETPFFLRKSASLLAENERSELIVFLGMNPDVGDVIPEGWRHPQSPVSRQRERQKWGRPRDLLFSQRDASTVPVNHIFEEPAGELNEGRTERIQEARSPSHEDVCQR